mmetsp:Transcript_1559/g.1853  ORF Transcript_1559/g.1853 Transcript_1559/m.1853 type:complete len:145 (-) Transcript_1559:54-488(-)
MEMDLDNRDLCLTKQKSSRPVPSLQVRSDAPFAAVKRSHDSESDEPAEESKVCAPQLGSQGSSIASFLRNSLRPGPARGLAKLGVAQALSPLCKTAGKQALGQNPAVRRIAEEAKAIDYLGLDELDDLEDMDLVGLQLPSNRQT